MRKLIGMSLAALLVVLPGTAFADAKFEAFIQTLWPRVKAAGYSRDLFDQAFAGITEPDPAVVKLANTQPEFKIATGDYLGTAVTPARIETGKTIIVANDALLAAIEKKYGVDRYVLLGIWGMESNFGKDEG
jgi:membrane-bound lytic murein transglycosylase B